MVDDLERDPLPADFIRKELETRGLTQADLAFVLGVPQQAVNLIALGKRGISADMARALGEVFQVPAERLLKLQKAAEVKAELARARKPDPGIAQKARLISTYPVREMIKRGWIDPDAPTLESEITRFFGVSAMDELPHLAHAGKKTSYVNVPPAQLAWLFRVRQIAREMVVPEFSPNALRGVLERLRALLTAPEEARHVPRILAEVGVRFVIVESLPSAKIDGVCMWISATSPVIGMSLRFDRIDNFWFVLRHEIEHVLNRDGIADAVIDVDLSAEGGSAADNLPPHESRANGAASDFCVPTAQMDSWVARKHPFYSERDLIGFAKRMQVHPGLVAGQLRNRTHNYKIFARHLDKIRFSVTPSSVVDGWGQVAPVSA